MKVNLTKYQSHPLKTSSLFHLSVQLMAPQDFSLQTLLFVQILQDHAQLNEQESYDSIQYFLLLMRQ